MKTILPMIITGLLLLTSFHKGHAQSIADDITQLTLDYQKLSSLKNILNEMKQGYQIVSTGYNSVKSVAQGNFTLNQAFLDGLMIVSPTVRKYPHVAQIATDQATLISEYKSAFATFKADKHFTVEEMSYMTDVYNNIVSGSLENLNELAMVITDNKLRMSDNERLQAIDRIYASGRDELTFLRQFNDQTKNEGIRRAEQTNDLNTLQNVYGLK